MEKCEKVRMKMDLFPLCRGGKEGEGGAASLAADGPCRTIGLLEVLGAIFHWPPPSV